MTDKRVVKTKRNLKATLTRLLKTKKFEKITVTDICTEGETSRITFYNYYADKYALVDEMFKDFFTEAINEYHSLQSSTNPSLDDMSGYKNMVIAILDLCRNHYDFFSNAVADRNPYLFSTFYRYVSENVSTYMDHHHATMKPKYPIPQLTALFCNGLWGIIAESLKSDEKFNETKDVIFSILEDMLSSGLYVHAEAK